MKKDITDRLLDLDVLGPATLREAVDIIKNLRQSNTDLLGLLYRAVDALDAYSGGESKELAYIERRLKTFEAKANIDV